jgi:peptidoglycan glycosyltransferase
MKLIKRNIRLVILFVCVLLAALVAYGAYSLSYFGNRWFSSAANTYLRQAKRDVLPGNVYDRNNILLAYNDQEGKRVYHPDARTRSALVHLLGDGKNNVAYGVDTFMSSLLYAFDASYLDRLSAAISGRERQGYDLRLSVDSALSAYIAGQFPQGKNGAVVVINYRTGELLSLNSFPGFDPMAENPDIEKDPLQPYWSRATRWKSAPGSTFKVVTLAAALQHIPDVMSRTFTCTGGLQVGDTVITDAGMAVHGELNLQKALAVSCNITFAKVALELGNEALQETCRAFGIDDYLLFSDLVVENSTYPSTNRVDKEVAWTGAGQSALALTPLHMVLITAAIANGGEMMEPKLLLQAVDGARRAKAVMVPAVYKTPLEAEDAATITLAMRQAVLTGSATRAGVSGLKVAGKTGSAQIDGQENTNAWFIGFIQDKSLPYALCVVVADGGEGGRVAAPLAGSIFKYLKEHNPVE